LSAPWIGVVDHGPGIPPEEQAAVFEPFMVAAAPAQATEVVNEPQLENEFAHPAD
jgi:K+-sensing histidine kinase KdpD